MAKLYVAGNSNHHFLQVNKTRNDHEWELQAGRWWMGRNDVSDFVTKTPVLLDVNGCKVLCDEMEKALNVASSEDKKLNLAFSANEPDMAVFMNAMLPGASYYQDSLSGKVRISVVINSSSSVIAPEQSGFGNEHETEFTAARNEAGVLRWTLREYFLPSDVVSFIQELRVEIAK
jgi:hypothetical protein